MECEICQGIGQLIQGYDGDGQPMHEECPSCKGSGRADGPPKFGDDDWANEEDGE